MQIRQRNNDTALIKRTDKFNSDLKTAIAITGNPIVESSLYLAGRHCLVAVNVLYFHSSYTDLRIPAVSWLINPTLTVCTTTDP